MRQFARAFTRKNQREQSAEQLRNRFDQRGRDEHQADENQQTAQRDERKIAGEQSHDGDDEHHRADDGAARG